MSVILGINAFHASASAAVIIDGKVICAIPEERLNRAKYYGSFPKLAVSECLRLARVTIEEVEYCHGTLAIFRRQCLQEIGLFDEGYFAYGDETEIGLRARRKKWKVGLVWGAILVNPGSWTGNAVVAYLATRNSLRMVRSLDGIWGMNLRLGVVLTTILRDWARRVPFDTNASPPAKWLAVKDYFRGRTGGPPQELLDRREARAR